MSNLLLHPDRAAAPGLDGREGSRRPTLRERGQALVLIAVAFVGLAAFIGLAVDAGILFTQIGHLRRAVDAAALGAANQFREGRSVDELARSATEFINLNGISTGTAQVLICEEPFVAAGYAYLPANDDPTLCPSPGDPYRKFVRVRGEVIVNFAFLPIIGFYSIPIHADAISETAAVDIVLVIDTSSSMAFDLCKDYWDPPFNTMPIDNDEDGVANDCPGANPGPPPFEWDTTACNLNRFQPDDDGPGEDASQLPLDGDREDDCHPFEEVRQAAKALVQRMYFPYDRMAIVTFDRTGSRRLNLADGNNAAAVNNALDSIEVSANPVFVPGDPDCHWGTNPGDPRGCGNSNPSDGLKVGGNLYADPNADGIATPGEIRQEAVWIMILLSDGTANALYDTTSYPLTDARAWLCPNPSLAVNNPQWVEPWCGDIDPSNTPSTTFGVGRHYFTASPDLYDPTDAARDMADFVGCPDSTSPQPAACAEPGQGAVIFTIGLGGEVTDTKCDVGVYDPDGKCGNLAEELLRYVAGAGDDNDPGTPAALDPCNGVAAGNDCGNYYFAPSGAGLLRVFEAIASRIFTRLTH